MHVMFPNYYTLFDFKKISKLTALPHVKSSVFPLTVIALTEIVDCKIFKIIIHHHEETVIFFFKVHSLPNISSLLFLYFFLSKDESGGLSLGGYM